MPVSVMCVEGTACVVLQMRSGMPHVFWRVALLAVRLLCDGLEVKRNVLVCQSFGLFRLIVTTFVSSGCFSAQLLVFDYFFTSLCSSNNMGILPVPSQSFSIISAKIMLIRL